MSFPENHSRDFYRSFWYLFMQWDDSDRARVFWIFSRIGNLLNLIHFDLSHNRLSIQTIPPNFFELPCLERLYLSENRIEKITENFGKFPTSLRVLALRDNKINSIHPDISKYDLWSLNHAFLRQIFGPRKIFLSRFKVFS